MAVPSLQLCLLLARHLIGSIIFQLFNYLLDAGISFLVAVEVLCNWYAKMFVIRWNSSLSFTFAVESGVGSRMCAAESGVTQGSTMSPSICNVSMNAFIIKLRLLDDSYHVNLRYVGCFLYADDIILISPSIIGLQQMLVVCSATAKSFVFKFDCNRSHRPYVIRQSIYSSMSFY